MTVDEKGREKSFDIILLCLIIICWCGLPPSFM